MRAMWLMLNSSVIAFLLGGLIASCSGLPNPQGAPGPQRSAALSDAALRPNEPPKPNPSSTPTLAPETVPTGELIFKNKCGTCHSLPTADRLKIFPSDKAMLDWVIKMAQLAGLNANETQEVLDYTQALRRSGR